MSRPLPLLPLPWVSNLFTPKPGFVFAFKFSPPLISPAKTHWVSKELRNPAQARGLKQRGTAGSTVLLPALESPSPLQEHPSTQGTSFPAPGKGSRPGWTGLGALLWQKCPCPWQGWDKMGFKVPSAVEAPAATMLCTPCHSPFIQFTPPIVFSSWFGSESLVGCAEGAGAVSSPLFSSTGHIATRLCFTPSSATQVVQGIDSRLKAALGQLPRAPKGSGSQEFYKWASMANGSRATERCCQNWWLENAPQKEPPAQPCTGGARDPSPGAALGLLWTPQQLHSCCCWALGWAALGLQLNAPALLPALA